MDCIDVCLFKHHFDLNEVKVFSRKKKHQMICVTNGGINFSFPSTHSSMSDKSNSSGNSFRRFKEDLNQGFAHSVFKINVEHLSVENRNLVC
nr:hypothetical transcript [Hymenolepis microstoma]